MANCEPTIVVEECDNNERQKSISRKRKSGSINHYFDRVEIVASTACEYTRK